MKQFKVTEVECNGVGGYGYQAVLKHKPQIDAICQEVRDLLGDKLWPSMIEHAEMVDKNHWDYHAGSRYSSVEDNGYRLVTGIAKHVSTYLKDDKLIEMHVGAVLNNLTRDEKVYLVLDALRDCASADHWYTFEKDWG